MFNRCTFRRRLPFKFVKESFKERLKNIGCDEIDLPYSFRCAISLDIANDPMMINDNSSNTNDNACLTQYRIKPGDICPLTRQVIATIKPHAVKKDLDKLPENVRIEM